MRILEAIDYYPPPLGGGRELQVQMLSHELIRRGHDVEVLSLARGGGTRVDWDGDVKVHRVPGWSRALGPLYADPTKPIHPPLPDPQVVAAARRLLKRFRPDVVHAHSWLLYSLLPLLPSAETRLVVGVHEYGFLCPKLTLRYRGGVCSGPGYAKCVACASEQYGRLRSLALTTGITAMRPWLRKVDRFVAVSQFTAQATSRLGAHRDRPFDVIPPFLVPSAFEADLAERPDYVPAEGDYIMFAGGLGPHKGLDILLQAWEGLEQPRTPLVLAGLRRPDTPARFPAGVIVAEEVPHEQVLRGWGHCVLAVVPSNWPDPSPGVALEAMAAGKPVVASAMGGLPEIVANGSSGLLVPPGDTEALRGAMSRLLADPPLRAQMGAEGKRRAQAYSAEVVVAAWERIFAEVAGGQGRQPLAAFPTTMP